MQGILRAHTSDRINVVPFLGCVINILTKHTKPRRELRGKVQLEFLMLSKATG